MSSPWCWLLGTAGLAGLFVLSSTAPASGAGESDGDRVLRECGSAVTPEEARAFRKRWATPPPPAEILPGPLCVPIAAHIVRRSDGTGGLSLDRLRQALTDANVAYAPAGLSFYTACAIDYIDSDDFYLNVNTNAEIDALRLVNVVPAAINIYFTANLSNEDGGLCGKSSFTTSAVQGIAMNNDCTAQPDNASTFPHEIGHYFDLFHTHETALGTELVDGSNCGTAGDVLCGTPADPNLDGKVNASCLYTGADIDPNGDPYVPDPRQYLSYSLKECRDTFSADSYVRALSTLALFRPDHITSCPAAPTITCADRRVCNAPGACNAPIDCAVGTAFCADRCGAAGGLSCVPAGPYGIGTTSVAVSCTDGTSITDKSCEVRVRDCEAPGCSAPPPLLRECNARAGVSVSDPAVATFLAAASAADNCPGVVLVSFPPPLFAAGCGVGTTTEVVFGATDANGNRTCCTGDVTVRDTSPPALLVPAPIELECSGPGGNPATDCDIALWLTDAVASDICSEVTLANDAPAFFPAACPPGAATGVTFTATDACGLATAIDSQVTVFDTTPPDLTACALARPAPPAPPASANSAEFRIDCGSTTDLCASDPVTLAAELVVRRHDVGGAGCVERVDVIDVACDEVVELVYLAPVCAARPPHAPRSALSVRSDGVKVVMGEEIVLEVRASDTCGNVSPACAVDAATLCLPRPEPPACDEPVCGAPFAPVAASTAEDFATTEPPLTTARK